VSLPYIYKSGLGRDSGRLAAQAADDRGSTESTDWPNGGALKNVWGIDSAGNPYYNPAGVAPADVAHFEFDEFGNPKLVKP
jgi:hypothetical protein